MHGIVLPPLYIIFLVPIHNYSTLHYTLLEQCCPRRGVHLCYCLPGIDLSPMMATVAECPEPQRHDALPPPLPAGLHLLLHHAALPVCQGGLPGPALGALGE